MLGHDLRNPLAAVSAGAELPARRRAEPELAQLGQRMHLSVKRMSRLIDDMMDFARGRFGSGIGVTLDETHDLAQALGDIVAELRDAHPGRPLVEHIAIGGAGALRSGAHAAAAVEPARQRLHLRHTEHPIRVDALIDGDWLQIAARW